jgi:hypothetical protein
MAGGPNAAVVVCMYCTAKAPRVSEGLEDDWYQCDDCGRRFGIDWSGGQPETLCWPPSPEQLRMIRGRKSLR